MRQNVYKNLLSSFFVIQSFLGIGLLWGVVLIPKTFLRCLRRSC